MIDATTRRIGGTVILRSLRPALAVAAVAAALPIPVAYADEVVSWEFGDPRKNIACSLIYWPVGTRGSDHIINTAQCQIGINAWTGPQESGGTLPCAPQGYSFMLRETGTPTVQCFTDGQVTATVYYVLEYGQSKTAGSITCTSAPEPTGITCVNSSSGNMFRVSESSYEVI